MDFLCVLLIICSILGAHGAQTCPVPPVVNCAFPIGQLIPNPNVSGGYLSQYTVGVHLAESTDGGVTWSLLQNTWPAVAGYDASGHVTYTNREVTKAIGVWDAATNTTR